MAAPALPKGVTLYAVLGVNPAATAAELRVAYKRQALRSHPDKGGAAEKFRAVVVAFEVLSSSLSRAAYDEQLQRRAARGAARREQRAAAGPRTRVRGPEGPKDGASEPPRGGGPAAAAPRTSLRPAAAGAQRQAPPAPARSRSRRRARAGGARRHHSGSGAAAARADGARAHAGADPALRSPPGPPGRKRFEAVFHRRLARLFAVLAPLSPRARQVEIEAMSVALRQTMITFIEAQRTPSTAPDGATTGLASRMATEESRRTILSRDPCSSGSGGVDSVATDSGPDEEAALGGVGQWTAISDEDSDSDIDAVRGALAIEDGLLEEQEEGAPGPSPGVHGLRGRRRKVRGIKEVYAKGGYVYYDARISFRNMTLATRPSRRLEDAIHFHMTLATLRQRVQELEESEGQTEIAAEATARAAHRFETSLRQAVGEIEELPALGISYQVVIDGRNWVGRMVTSPRMQGIDEALNLWRDVELARPCGWPTLRGFWLTWMQVARRARWSIRTRTADEAAAEVAEKEGAFAATRLQRESARAAREARQRERLEARLRRQQQHERRRAQRAARQEAYRKAVIASAEKAVRAAVAGARQAAGEAARERLTRAARGAQAEARRRRREQLQAMKARTRARRSWLRRRDLTMEELRRGFPG